MSSSPRSTWFYPKADMPAVRPVSSTKTIVDRVTLAADARLPGHGSPHLLADGTFNSVWSIDAAGRRWALKLPREEHPSASLAEGYEVEAAALRAAAAADVDVPSDPWLDRLPQIIGAPYLVMEHVTGTSFRALDHDEGSLLPSYPAAARTLRRAHRIELDGYGLCVVSGGRLVGSHEHWGDYLMTRLPEHVDELMSADVITDSEGTRIGRILAPLSESGGRPGRLLHGDCGPHNMILRTHGGVALIDWEDATSGDPLFELAQWATFNPRRRWAAMLDAYVEGTWEPDVLFWRYFLRITIAKLVVRSRLELPSAPGRPTSHDRIREALAAFD